MSQIVRLVNTLKTKLQFHLVLLLFFIGMYCTLARIASAQPAVLPNEVFQLLANDGMTLGKGVAVSNSNGGAVAAALGGITGNNLVTGIYVFRWNGASWPQEQKLMPSDGANIFPGAIVTDRDLIVAAGANTTYIFRRIGSTWSEEQILPVGNAAATKGLGISGDRIVIGNNLEDSSQGAVYVYKYHSERSPGDRWVQEQRLLAPDRAEGYGRNFGFSTAILGNRIVIGAPSNSAVGTTAGAAYVFDYNGSNWVATQTLFASDGAVGQSFGRSVALDGSYIVIGADGVVTSSTPSGSWVGPAAYIFHLNGASWTEEAKLPSDGYRQFGSDVAVTGNTVVIGSSHAQRSYFYRKIGSIWEKTTTKPYPLTNPRPDSSPPPLQYLLTSASAGIVALSSQGDVLLGTYVMPQDVGESHQIHLSRNGSDAFPSGQAAGSITPPVTTMVSQGANKTFGIAPSAGHYINNIVVDEVPLGPLASYTFTNVSSAHTIRVAFGSQSDVTPPVAGDISYGPDPGNMGSGTLSGTVTIRSAASDNIGVSKVEFYAGTGSNPYSILIGTDYGAPFSVNWNTLTAANGTYVLTAKAFDTAPTPRTGIAQRTVTVGNGSFFITSGGNKSVTQGSSVIQNITASLTPGSVGQSTSFTVSGLPAGVTRSFPPACNPNCSASMTFSASAAATPGTFTISVTGIAGSNFASTTFDLTIAKPLGDNTQYTLTTVGDVSVSPNINNQIAYTAGTQLTLTANVAEYETFVGWSGCGNSQQNPIVITMDSNKTCTANTKPKLYVITANAGTGGAIYAYGRTINIHGATRAFNINLTTNNYRIADVLVDGSSVGAVTSYTFSNITANHTIAATFAPYNFTLSNGGDRVLLLGGSVTNTITATATEGSAPQVTFNASGFGGVTTSFNPPSCTPSCTTTITLTASAGATPGTYQVGVNAAGRATYFYLAVSSQTPTTVISSSSPPNGYIDPLEDQASDSSVLLGTRDIAISFSAAVTNSNNGPITISNFERTYYRGGVLLNPAEADIANEGIAPTLQLLSGSGAGPYLLRFTPRIPLGAWTVVRAINIKDSNGSPLAPSGSRVVYGAVPMDASQDGRVLGDDINRWLQINNNIFNPTPLTKLQLLDQKRNGVIAGEDITRGIQLLNGIGTFRAWSGYDIGPKP